VPLQAIESVNQEVGAGDMKLVWFCGRALRKDDDPARRGVPATDAHQVEPAPDPQPLKLGFRLGVDPAFAVIDDQ
jgi:hypothetical protein